jgi:hypothetical protein
MKQAQLPNSVITSMRGFYGRNVVGRVLAAPPGTTTQVTHNYEAIPGAIPIPATLSLELGRVISEQQQNITYRFVSDYPFKNRAPHVLDDFERNALNGLLTAAHYGKQCEQGIGWRCRPRRSQVCLSVSNGLRRARLGRASALWKRCVLLDQVMPLEFGPESLRNCGFHRSCVRERLGFGMRSHD